MEDMMKTYLHIYEFNLEDAEQAQAYATLEKRLVKTHDRMPSYRHKEEHSEGPIELDTTYIFRNQWNTETGRVMDWEEVVFYNTSYKKGYYLDITEEMRAIRDSTWICGYCGRQYRGEHPTFCTKCLDSPYLKETDLFLLRLVPVSKQQYHTLTKEEHTHIVHLYKMAQVRRVVPQDDQVWEYKRIEEDMQHATTRYKGLRWLLNHGIGIANCIYYESRGVFSFGWQVPLSHEAELALQKRIHDFPYKYEVVIEEGGIVSR